MFGDLEDNTPHPNGWDNVTFIFSSKSKRGKEEEDTRHGCVGTDFLTKQEGEGDNCARVKNPIKKNKYCTRLTNFYSDLNRYFEIRT